MSVLPDGRSPTTIPRHERRGKGCYARWPEPLHRGHKRASAVGNPSCNRALGRRDHAPTARQTRWTIVEEDDLWRPQAFARTWRLSESEAEGLQSSQNDPACFESYRPEVGIELRATPAALAGGDLRANPACHALGAWLAGPSTQVLHAGAVAYEGAAALIVGAGGAGKSTTVFACAMAGAGFLGDDFVLVESAGDNTMRSQLSTACSPPLSSMPIARGPRRRSMAEHSALLPKTRLWSQSRIDCR